MLTTTSSMPLLYADDGYLSHQVRLVLLEKQIAFNELDIRSDDSQIEDLADLNPYNTLPVLVHRELILYENQVIFEYLEERYHQYRLLPDNPIERAQYRQLLWRVQHDWMQLAAVLLTHQDTLDAQAAATARAKLSASLVTMSPLFSHKPFFMSDHFGLIDCILATLLYRLPQMQIPLPTHLCRPLIQYKNRLMARPTFQQSLLVGN